MGNGIIFLEQFVAIHQDFQTLMERIINVYYY